MSTPHKLNVTFWDMPEEPGNGSNQFQMSMKRAIFDPIGVFFRPVPVRFCSTILFLILVWAVDATRIIGIAMPLLAVASVYFWHAVLYRGKLSEEMSYGLFCVSVFGEMVGGYCGGFGIRTAVHSGVLVLTGLLVGQEPTLMLYAGCRLFLWACLTWMPDSARLVLCYASCLCGVLAAKYVEAFLMGQILPDLKLSTPRRRRTSNHAIFNVYKMRRTSLPALGGSFKSSNHGFQPSL